MSARLPPLLALPAFAAAARHLSFTHAAEELFVTQGAISRQIRVLEEHLGQKLFERFTRRVELTPAGLEYQRSIQQALDMIDSATQHAMRVQERSVINLSVMPTLGTGWLMPRLATFSESHPQIDVRLVTSIEPANLQSGEVDAAIRVGCLPGAPMQPGQPRIDLEMVRNWKGVSAELLFPDVLVPVVSRKLLAQGKPVGTPRDLLAHRLIHTASRKYAWPDWLAAHGVRLPAATASIHFGHFFMGLRAAEQCKGVAIVPSIVLQGLAHGSDLVCPLPADVPSAGNYYLLTREASRGDPNIEAFRNWLMGEALQELLPQRLPAA
ncbi:LysR substrate-binding domain-containing protein [Xylophilus sp. GOD-11R]|uniref:LysR substrate-binding domain-containing protein n=1 Tax=Xylophilus sp. GOD-11R TaxID=3089814 RepID=UPI00298C146B|nr:LysR substrate-binding domain-containing protein [Xylophilus sp. GOD-11R]WPB57450.1 LysR substrate-binding domain-containing protein [Xylophilus sp. GOD-11R]